MLRPHRRGLLDLPAARLGVAGRLAGSAGAHLVEQGPAYRLRDVVLLLLHPVCARDAAAVVVHVARPQPRNQREQVHGRQPDPVGSQLAGGVVGKVLVQPPEARVQAAVVVEVQQELADVPGGVGHDLRVVVVHVEHLAVLGLDRMGARG